MAVSGAAAHGVPRAKNGLRKATSNVCTSNARKPLSKVLDAVGLALNPKKGQDNERSI